MNLESPCSNNNVNNWSINIRKRKEKSKQQFNLNWKSKTKREDNNPNLLTKHKMEDDHWTAF